jgi:hypothetical protein
LPNSPPPPLRLASIRFLTGSLGEDKFEDIGEIKHEEPQVPVVDLKPLPKGLKYEFLGPDKTYPVILSDELSPEENDKLLNLLKKHKKVTGYSINDLKGHSPTCCTHRIPMEDQCKPVVDQQRRLTHAMREVVKRSSSCRMPKSSTRCRIANG